MSTPTDTMHSTQTTYIAARAAYQEACAEAGRRTKDLQIERLGAEMREAEDAMLAWSFVVARETIKSGPRAQRSTKLGLVADIESRCRTSLVARTGALDLALRLSA